MIIGICDDSTTFLDEFIPCLNRCTSKEDVVFQYSNGFALLQDWHEGRNFDLLCLDIEMPGFSGFDTAHEIRQLSGDMLIAIITEHSERALESFKHEPFDFLVKPITASQIKSLLDRARKRTPLPPTFVIPSGKGLVRVPIKEIVYAEIFRKKITVHTTTKDYIYNGRMADVRRTLEPHGFYLCHRSVLVNMDYVVSILSMNREAILKYNDCLLVLPVSADRLQAFLRMRTVRDLF